jgi:hypothetical protein
MISYLLIGFSGQLIRNYNIADLFHLIKLALVPARLQIQDFRGTLPKEDVMACLYPFLEAKPPKKLHHPREGYIRIGVSPQDLF